MKTIIFFFLTLLPLQLVYAQITWGIYAGGSLSDIALVNEPDGIDFFDDNSQLKPSALVGVYASLPIVTKMKLITALQYSNKGSKTTNPCGSTSRINLHYLSVPVLVRYNLFDRWFIEVGPEIAYLITDRSGNNTLDFYESLDFGINAGLGYSLSEVWSAKLRYYVGLSSIITDIQLTDTNGALIDHSLKLQNRFLQLSLARQIGSF
ncbi:MAG: porin family protein [Tunicatimonas sp.]|uniref:porin family protein n=1 Tax=Tunicatimonas sp. TaxID=1940096 RepID=UPI003C763C57